MSKPYTLNEAQKLKQAMLDITTIVNDHPAMDFILADIPPKLKEAIEWIAEMNPEGQGESK